MENFRKAVPVLARWVTEQRPLSHVAALGRDENFSKFSRRFCSVPLQPAGSSRFRKGKIEIYSRQGYTGGQHFRSESSLHEKAGRLRGAQDGYYSNGRVRRFCSDHGAEERESMDYDVVIVGAGPSGLAAAIRLKQLCKEKDVDLSVCVVEKGAEVGKSLNFPLLVSMQM